MTNQTNLQSVEPKPHRGTPNGQQDLRVPRCHNLMEVPNNYYQGRIASSNTVCRTH